MIFVSDAQHKALVLVDEFVRRGDTHKKAIETLIKCNYDFEVEIKNGYMNRTTTRLLKDGEYVFVDLVKRRNGLTTYNYTELS